MPLSKFKKPLSVEEQRELTLALLEMESRGLKIPVEYAKSDSKIVWPTSPLGYFVKRDGTIYNPTEAQEGFINCTQRFSLFYGGRGSGKSGAGSQKALKKIQSGQSGAVINPLFSDFKDSTWKEFKEWIPWDMVVPSQRHRANPEWQPTQPFTMVFMNGATVQCKGLKNPDSARGPNINWLWYDESRNDPTGLAWKTAIASVRIGDNPQAWTTTTPMGISHWLYEFFIEKKLPEEVLEILKSEGRDVEDLIATFHGSINDNKQNLDPGFYISVLSNYPSGWLKAREVEGEFAEEGGKIGDSSWLSGRRLSSSPEKVISRVRFWDLAATEKKAAKNDPDDTCGSLVSKFMPSETMVTEYNEVNVKDPNYCLEHQISGQWEWERLLEVVKNTARRDGPLVEIFIEQEPGSGGKNQIAAIKSEFKKEPDLQNYRIHEVLAKEVGDRVLAANTYWFGISAQKKMWYVSGEWNDRFLKQLDGFTQLPHDDLITSVTGAMYKLNPFRIWKKVPFVSI